MKKYLDKIVDQAWEDATAQFIPVKLLQDDSSHWYIVPLGLTDEFRKLNNWLCENEDANDFSEKCGEFDDLFGKYRTGGGTDLYQLYILQEDLNKLIS